MDAIFSPPFVTMVWLFPLAVALHQAEKINLQEWLIQHFKDLPPITHISVGFSLALPVAAAVLWSWIALFTNEGYSTAWVLLPGLVMMSTQALQTLIWAARFKAYAPGLVTGVGVVLPVALYLGTLAQVQALVPPLYGQLYLLLILPGVISTLRAGHRLDPFNRYLQNKSLEWAKIWPK